MTDIYKAARQALEALEVCEVHGYIPVRLTCQAVTALRQAIEQAEEQEPVAWMWKFDDEGAAFSTCEPTASIKDGVNYVPLYTAPPKREWVGLTDEAVIEEAKWHLGEMQVENCGADNIQAFARAIEAKLKEKNT